MKTHGVPMENLQGDCHLGRFIAGVAALYLAIGIIFWVIMVIKIRMESRRSRKNAASQAALNLDHGDEEGSTPISLYLPPFFLIMFLWPFSLCHGDANDEPCF